MSYIEIQKYAFGRIFVIHGWCAMAKALRPDAVRDDH